MPRKYNKIPTDDRKKGDYYEYKRERERIAKKTDWFEKKLDECIDKARKNFNKKLKSAYFKIANDAIKEWYDAYEPKAYKRRKKSLYQVPYFEIDKETGDIYYGEDSDGITRWHRVSGEYIYFNSYWRGYHGGADMLGDNPAKGYEMPHPNPRSGPLDWDNTSGVPYWRWPTKPKGGFIRWQIWYPTPAVKTISPSAMVEQRWPQKREEIKQEFIDEVIKMVFPYAKEFTDFVKKYKRW